MTDPKVHWIQLQIAIILKLQINACAALVSILCDTSTLNSAASSNMMQSSNPFYPRASITCHDPVVHNFQRTKEIMKAVTIPVMAKARIGHFAEAQILEAIGVDMIDESEGKL